MKRYKQGVKEEYTLRQALGLATYCLDCWAEDEARERGPRSAMYRELTEARRLIEQHSRRVDISQV